VLVRLGHKQADDLVLVQVQGAHADGQQEQQACRAVENDAAYLFFFQKSGSLMREVLKREA
jgi:hypothetical protein